MINKTYSEDKVLHSAKGLYVHYKCESYNVFG